MPRSRALALAASLAALVLAHSVLAHRHLSQAEDATRMEPPTTDDTLTSYLSRAGDFELFLRALRHFGLDRPLDGKDKKKICVPSGPAPPCYFYYCPPAPCEWVPERKNVSLVAEDGPFTVLAFNDEAMRALLSSWIPDLSLERVFKSAHLSARLEDALLYHIVKGASVTTADMAAADAAAFTVVRSARSDEKKSGADLALFPDMDGGVIRIHEDCVDKAPLGAEHGCLVQAGWGKCTEPWMSDDGNPNPSFRPWGFCELSCRKCECDSDKCAKTIEQGDLAVTKTNVTVHVLSGAIRPPRRFSSFRCLLLRRHRHHHRHHRQCTCGTRRRTVGR